MSSGCAFSDCIFTALMIVISRSFSCHLLHIWPCWPVTTPSSQALCFPIDTSLSFVQANKLIRDLKPSNLVLPRQYTIPPILQPHRSDLVIEAVCWLSVSSAWFNSAVAGAHLVYWLSTFCEGLPHSSRGLAISPTRLLYGNLKYEWLLQG